MAKLYSNIDVDNTVTKSNEHIKVKSTDIHNKSHSLEDIGDDGIDNDLEHDKKGYVSMYVYTKKRKGNECRKHEMTSNKSVEQKYRRQISLYRWHINLSAKVFFFLLSRTNPNKSQTR